MYTKTQIDEGVALAGGAYRVQWGEYGESYYKNPTPPDIYYEYLYVLDWQTPESVIKVQVDQLVDFMRDGEYLEKAFSVLEEAFGAVISTIPIVPDGETTAEDWALVCVGGFTGIAPTLSEAKWQAVGLWGLENLYEDATQGYLKIGTNEGAVFMIDENTYLTL